MVQQIKWTGELRKTLEAAGVTWHHLAQRCRLWSSVWCRFNGTVSVQKLVSVGTHCGLKRILLLEDPMFSLKADLGFGWVGTTWSRCLKVWASWLAWRSLWTKCLVSLQWGYDRKHMETLISIDIHGFRLNFSITSTGNQGAVCDCVARSSTWAIIRWSSCRRAYRPWNHSRTWVGCWSHQPLLGLQKISHKNLGITMHIFLCHFSVQKSFFFFFLRWCFILNSLVFIEPAGSSAEVGQLRSQDLHLQTTKLTELPECVLRLKENTGGLRFEDFLKVSFSPTA